MHSKLLNTWQLFSLFSYVSFHFNESMPRVLSLFISLFIFSMVCNRHKREHIFTHTQMNVHIHWEDGMKWLQFVILNSPTINKISIDSHKILSVRSCGIRIILEDKGNVHTHYKYIFEHNRDCLTARKVAPLHHCSILFSHVCMVYSLQRILYDFVSLVT